MMLQASVPFFFFLEGSNKSITHLVILGKFKFDSFFSTFFFNFFFDGRPSEANFFDGEPSGANFFVGAAVRVRPSASVRPRPSVRPSVRPSASVRVSAKRLSREGPGGAGAPPAVLMGVWDTAFGQEPVSHPGLGVWDTGLGGVGYVSHLKI